MQEDTASLNGIAWSIGWHPTIVITALGIVGGLVGLAINPTLTVIPTTIGFGIVLGLVLWVWGLREVNGEFESVVQQFVSEQEQHATRDIQVRNASTFSLLHRMEDSPLFVKPGRRYEHTVLVLGESSVTLNMGAKFNLVKRVTTTGGHHRELFYDQIAAVETYNEGDYGVLQIRTGVDSLEIASAYTNKIDAAGTELRQRVRDAKTN